MMPPFLALVVKEYYYHFNAQAQMYIRSLPKMNTVPWKHLYPNGSPAALDLLNRLLQFDPELRYTVEQTLAHPYLESYHDSEDEV
jgi:serine/threonine protein kinase